jgi:hypothetical protein
MYWLNLELDFVGEEVEVKYLDSNSKQNTGEEHLCMMYR